MSAKITASAVLVLGDARRAALVDRLRVLLKEWATQWGVVNLPDIQIDLMPLDSLARSFAHSTASSLRCVLDGDVMLNIDARAPLVEALLNLPRERAQAASSIGVTLHAEVTRSLADALIGAIPSQQWRIEAGPEEAERRKRGLQARIKLHAGALAAEGDADIDLWLSSNFVSRLLPVRAPPIALAKRAAAIGTEKIPLRAVLGETQVSVGELATLAVDDVLVVQDAAPSSAHLSTQAGARVASISLGRAGHKRAVQITALASQR